MRQNASEAEGPQVETGSGVAGREVETAREPAELGLKTAEPESQSEVKAATNARKVTVVEAADGADGTTRA